MMMTSLIAVFDPSSAAGTVAGIGMLSAWTAAGVWTLVKHKRLTPMASRLFCESKKAADPSSRSTAQPSRGTDPAHLRHLLVYSDPSSGRSSVDRAPVFGTGCRGFESLRPGHSSP